MVITGIDIETTGLDYKEGHRIIEVCASIYDVQSTQRHRLVRTWTQRINPLRPIDKGAENVHGISLLDLRGQPEWERVAPTVAKILAASQVVVAHNAAFDMPFIANELMRVKLPIPDFQVFCTMETGRNATPFGKLPNLGELCFAYGVDYDPSQAHAAEYDVTAMMSCLFAGLRSGDLVIEGLPVENHAHIVEAVVA